MLSGIFLLLLFLTIHPDSFGAENERKVYIVYMGEKPNHQYSTESLHLTLLEEVIKGSKAEQSLVYSYGRSFNGFAAKLTAAERDKLANKKEIVSVFLSKTLQLHTTRSWDFLGFPLTASHNAAGEMDVIVGMIDTGIWPESSSFSDEGFSAPPRRWKGICQNFTCNNKIIGARYYYTEDDIDHQRQISARDFEGHGTHTASTVAGREVKDVSLYGIAGGTVRGAVPSARIAVYKVCWVSKGCAEHNILAAFDDAIADGVDIISASIGKSGIFDYYEDTLAIGSFHAMKIGILTSFSAGNDGELHGTVSNTAPWALTVAASTIDRRLVVSLVIDDKDVIEGNSINTFETEKMSYPFILAENASKGNLPRECEFDTLNGDIVKGKILLCNMWVDGDGPLRAGAKGVVMIGNDHLDISWPFPLPAAVVDAQDGEKLTNYIKGTSHPVVNIHRASTVIDDMAPQIASISSRGPNPTAPNILKPDISAPGINILAAWSPVARMTESDIDDRLVYYNIQSGTSMACPHATAAAAYVKSFHPDWSPAALMSALITTATPMDPLRNPDAELAYGAGQINPTQAAHPGLVYDANVQDYIHMLCSIGYNSGSVRLISGDKTDCSSESSIPPSWDLNYPSMAFRAMSGAAYSVNFSRTLTNVGTAKATYKATVKIRGKIEVIVKPDLLSFSALNEKQSFVVTVTCTDVLFYNQTASASLVWSDGEHSVRSPIVIHTGYYATRNKMQA